LAAVLWGDEDGHLNLIEIHNISRAPRASRGGCLPLLVRTLTRRLRPS
jgi:hypothetical protein